MWLRVKWLEDKSIVCKTLELQGVVVWISKKKRALFPRGSREAHGGLDDEIHVASQPLTQRLELRRSQDDAEMGYWYLMLIHRIIAVGQALAPAVVKDNLMAKEI